MQKKAYLTVVLIAAAMLLSSNAYAISANSAANYVSIQNHFLYAGEEYEQPNVKVKYSNTLYWVIPVTMNDELSTFFAMDEAKGELSMDKGANRLIFRASALLRNYNLTKKEISDRKNVWLITTEYSKKFGSLATMLQDETSDLTIIRTTINKSAVSQDISEMSSKLVSMGILCTGISRAIDEAIAFEAEFSTEADSAKYEGLKDRLGNVFSMVSDLDDIAISYREDASKLKQTISSEESLPPDNKSLLISTATPPAEFGEIGSYATNSAQLQSSMESIYSNIQKNMDSYLNEFDERIKRNESYNLLYEENAGLKAKTDGYLASLDQARVYILDKENVEGWQDKEAVSLLSSYWGLAKDYFDKRDYAKAKDYGEKAIKEAITVYEGGIANAESQPLFSNDTIIKIVVVLAALLIGLFAWNSRGKIMSSFGGGKDKEELEL